MTFCPHCEGADAIFDQKTAEDDLRDYQQGGAGGTTGQLLDAIKAAGVAGLSLLDIGGGIGVIQHELAAAGVERVTDVDASRAYLRMAQAEAGRRGYRSEEHTSELQSRENLVCRLLLEKKNTRKASA